MPEGGFYQARRISPAGLAIVVAAHAAAIAALAMARMEAVETADYTPIEIRNVPLPPEPAPAPQPEPRAQPRPRSEITYVPPFVPAPRTDALDIPVAPTLDPPVFDAGPAGKADVPPSPRADPLPRPEPVRVEARLRAGELQPPYPPSEERLGREGSVRVRVTIGANGRVVRVEKLSATSDAFFRATERHALRAWRFEPATVDGRPVESVKTLTVHFRLNG